MMKLSEKETTYILPNNNERILRLEEVKERTGLSRSTIYLSISKGTFPKNVALGPRCVGWLQSEIDAWIMSCIQRSRSHSGIHT